MSCSSSIQFALSAPWPCYKSTIWYYIPCVPKCQRRRCPHITNQTWTIVRRKTSIVLKQNQISSIRNYQEFWRITNVCWYQPCWQSGAIQLQRSEPSKDRFYYSDGGVTLMIIWDKSKCRHPLPKGRQPKKMLLFFWILSKWGGRGAAQFFVHFWSIKGV